jgi:2-polyprenyl-6-methoxyphenol hydroxylase-like FAD-dependent oxidoreductase
MRLGALHIAVTGCGPGGLASALLLHRAGHRVTVFDQFAKPAPLGSGLLIQPSGQLVLKQLGLLDRIKALSLPVTRLSGQNAVNGKRALDMEYRHLGVGASALGIHRASLFKTLFDAVKKERIPIQPKCRLVGAVESVGHVHLKFEKAAD